MYRVGRGVNDELIARLGGVVPSVCVKLCVWVCVCVCVCVWVDGWARNLSNEAIHARVWLLRHRQMKSNNEKFCVCVGR